MIGSLIKVLGILGGLAIAAGLIERLTRPPGQESSNLTAILGSHRGRREEAASREENMASKDPREPFTRISVAEAKEKIDSGNVQVIDVRTMGEYAGGHVPGSLNIPHMSVIGRKDELAKDKELVFICELGQRSALAAEFAAAAGFKDLYNVEGGTQAWIKAGFAVE